MNEDDDVMLPIYVYIQKTSYRIVCITFGRQAGTKIIIILYNKHTILAKIF